MSWEINVNRHHYQIFSEWLATCFGYDLSYYGWGKPLAGTSLIESFFFQTGQMQYAFLLQLDWKVISIFVFMNRLSSLNLVIKECIWWYSIVILKEKTAYMKQLCRWHSVDSNGKASILTGFNLQFHEFSVNILFCYNSRISVL